MKVVWSLDKDVAIPVENIKSFEIDTIDEWGEQSIASWDGGRYYVRANFTICTGTHVNVFTADTKEECIDFIEKI